MTASPSARTVSVLAGVLVLAGAGYGILVAADRRADLATPGSTGSSTRSEDARSSAAPQPSARMLVREAGSLPPTSTRPNANPKAWLQALPSLGQATPEAVASLQKILERTIDDLVRFRESFRTTSRPDDPGAALVMAEHEVGLRRATLCLEWLREGRYVIVPEGFPLPILPAGTDAFQAGIEHDGSRASLCFFFEPGDDATFDAARRAREAREDAALAAKAAEFNRRPEAVRLQVLASHQRAMERIAELGKSSLDPATKAQLVKREEAFLVDARLEADETGLLVVRRGWRNR